MCAQPPGFKALQGKEEEVTDWEKHSLFRTLGGAHNAERPLTSKWPHPVWVRQWTGTVSQRQDQPVPGEQGSWDENAQALIRGKVEPQPL